ncbi:oxidoreductase domain-containing protein [Candidatus Omnitrophus magneticus]|uniref:Oxidoreductase domain-containing protein n=1 Tax=Candidatus Omnitrophus magneticus TaxID=1609969 RepID=A0A0F0CTI2_9BACT|nr:oxidoreductase domain-containing protein [Candidatus Omnitrophus magneticus]
MKNLKILVAGAGNWGKHLVRNYYDLGVLYGCCDVDEKRLEAVKRSFNPAKISNDFSVLVRDPLIDGVVISAPAVDHYRLAKMALDQGKAVYVEKPMALTAKDCEELVALAKKQKVVLMVGHLMLYHPAVRQIKAYIDKGELGDIYYGYSVRVNLGTVRRDENSLWSFAPHDISMLLYLFGSPVTSVSARGQYYLQKGIEDVVFLSLYFKDQKMAQIQISWLDPHKERKLTIVGSKKMLVFDDVENVEKIKIYDKGITVEQQKGEFDSYGDYLTLRSGDIYLPYVDMVEPLRVECRHFLECIKENKKPFTDGESGLEVVRILEKAQESLKQGGMPIEI